MKYRICTKCEIHHIENCGTCFGFGVMKQLESDEEGKTFIRPIAAGRAIDGDAGDWMPCPECKSTPAGISGGEYSYD